MLNKEQTSTILNYISLLNDEMKEHLRKTKILNKDGTLISSDGYKEVKKWFIKNVRMEFYAVENDIYGEKTVYLSIYNTHTKSGNQIDFNFPADQFGLHDLKSIQIILKDDVDYYLYEPNDDSFMKIKDPDSYPDVEVLDFKKDVEVLDSKHYQKYV